MNKIVIDNVLCMVESFPTAAFNESVISCNNNSIIINFDVYKYWISYSPPAVKFKKTVSCSLKTHSERLNYYISPVGILLQNLKLFILLLKICIKFRPKIIVAESYFIAMFAGVLRRFKLCKKSIYLSGDWLAASKDKNRFIGYIGNKFVFPFIDYVACKLNDVVFNLSDKISEARFDYWGKKITRGEKTIYLPLKILTRRTDLNKMNRNICFIGNLRADSGLDIVIKSLSKARKYGDFNLKIIGSYSHDYRYFSNLSKQYQMDQYIKFLGYMEKEKFDDILGDCFCGINMLTMEDNYTAYTLPAKLLDYLQYLLPVIVTENIGPTAEIVRSNKLGLVIEPDEEKFVEALIKIYKHQTQYRKNIVAYINSSPRTDIREFLAS